MKTSVLILMVMFAAEPFLSGQGGQRRQDELIGWHMLAGQLSITARRLGNRMQSVGKERVMLAGMLRDARGERMIQLTYQPSGLFRLDDPTTQRVVGFDGTVVDKRHGSGQASETEALIDTLVLSNPDMLFDALVRHRGQVRLIGHRFRVIWGQGPAASSSLADIYEIHLPRTAKGNRKAASST